MLTATTIESELREIMEGYFDLWNRHAIAEHSELFAEDADFVNVIGQHWAGRREICERHEQLHRTIFAKSTTRVLSMSVTALSDDLALSHMRWEMHGAAKIPGWNPPDPRTGVFTFLWTKVGGEWKVRAAHNTEKVAFPPLPEV